MNSCRKSFRTQDRSSRRNAHRESSPTPEELVRVFQELRAELVSKLRCVLGNYDEAQDAAQEAFLKCWRHREGIGAVRNLRAWIFRVGLNTAKDALRSGWRRRARTLVGCSARVDARATCPVRSAEDGEAKERLQQAILRLRPIERDVFLLRYTRGLTYEEIAKLRRSPVGTVKTQMRTAAAKLRQVLHEN
jgi:RNA polymerase sigma-70 factor (ECF subfamily)